MIKYDVNSGTDGDLLYVVGLASQANMWQRVIWPSSIARLQPEERYKLWKPIADDVYRCEHGYQSALDPDHEAKLASLRHEIEGRSELVVPSAVVDGFRQAAALTEHDVSAFLGRLDADPLTNIRVHLTRYGTGGSYHNSGLSVMSARGDAITVKEGDYKDWIAARVLVHETVHLAIEMKYVRNSKKKQILHEDAKEAIVDEICACPELDHLVKGYPVRSDKFEYLPNNWADFVKWKNSPRDWDSSKPVHPIR